LELFFGQGVGINKVDIVTPFFLNFRGHLGSFVRFEAVYECGGVHDCCVFIFVVVEPLQGSKNRLVVRFYPGFTRGY
jgi:hypothetical protein